MRSDKRRRHVAAMADEPHLACEPALRDEVEKLAPVAGLAGRIVAGEDHHRIGKLAVAHKA